MGTLLRDHGYVMSGPCGYCGVLCEDENCPECQAIVDRYEAWTVETCAAIDAYVI